MDCVSEANKQHLSALRERPHNWLRIGNNFEQPIHLQHPLTVYIIQHSKLRDYGIRILLNWDSSTVLSQPQMLHDKTCIWNKDHIWNVYVIKNVA